MPAPGTSPSSSPCRTSVGTVIRRHSRRTRACSASASAPNRVVVTVAFAGSAAARSPTDGSRDSVAGSMSFGTASVGVDATQDPRERLLPARQRRVQAGRGQDREIRHRAVRQREVAGRDEPAHRVPVQDAPGGPRRRARTARSRSSRSSWSCAQRSTWPRRPPDPPFPRWSYAQTSSPADAIWSPTCSYRPDCSPSPCTMRTDAHAGPAQAPPASASSAGQCRTRRSVPSATVAWLTMEGMGAAYATGARDRRRPSIPCARWVSRMAGSSSVIASSCAATRSTTRTSASCSATARRSSSIPAARTARPARSRRTCAN